MENIFLFFIVKNKKEIKKNKIKKFFLVILKNKNKKIK